jgi:predicted dienelactone hydrolase
MNAAIADGVFGLVVISHGTGGSPLVYRTLGQYLARNGFLVALPEHPRNNRNNNDLAGTAAILVNRPRQIRSVIDWALAHNEIGSHLAPGAAAIIGHSLGGYTALALAGGTPTAFAHETRDSRPEKLETTSDERVRALVLLAPAAAWFMEPGALGGVSVPILMLTAEKDVHTPNWHAQLILEGVPQPSLIQHRIVQNAGHFSFLSPFPDSMTKPAFPPSQDPEGFDRGRFLSEMNADILAFLQRAPISPD